MKQFITSNPKDSETLFENFGVTFYFAQLLEDELKLILCSAKMLGHAKFHRKKELRIKNSDDGLLGASMGALKEVINKNKKEGDDDMLFDLLEEANKGRRLLAHRFFTEHAPDLQSEAGREATNQHLSKIYLTIRKAHTLAQSLREELFSRIGLSKEKMQEEVEKFRALINQEPDIGMK